MGKVMEISSAGNARIKAVAALGMKKYRQQDGLFMAEGAEVVSMGVRAGWELVSLVAVRSERLDEALVAAAGEVLVVSGSMMARLVRRENPQAVLGVFRQRFAGLQEMATGVVLVGESLRDPGNVGTIIRTLDAAGANGLVLVGACADVFAPECVRATMGSVFHVPVARCTLAEWLAWRQGFAGVVVGTDLRGAADYRSMPATRPLMVCLGSEHSGLSPAMLAACDLRVKIPMRGRAESLNVAVAAGVVLYRMTD